MYADVIVDLTNEKLDKVFAYEVPEALTESIRIGTEVVVPFGKGDRLIHGYIVGLSATTDYDPARTKKIREVVKDSRAIEARLVTLAAWMREHYGGTMIQALKTVLPIKKKENLKEQREVRLLLSKKEAGEAL